MKFVDDRTREYIFPKRIIMLEGDIKGAEFLLKEKELQIAISEPELCVITGKASIILDFGCEMCGGIRFLTKHTDTAITRDVHPKLRVRFGESVSETSVDIGFKGTTNDHAERDIQVAIGPHSDMEYGNTGFRFVRIDFVDEDLIAQIKAIVAVSVYRDIPYRGNFICSDKRLNEIYEVARRTCHLNMQSMLWDGIKRDRLVWIGDIHPEMMTIRCVFGDDKCIEEGLKHAVNQYKLPTYLNEKAPYSMWFVIILHDWYMQNNNLAFVKEQMGYVTELFENLDKTVDENGEMHLEEYFFDWPTHGYEGCGFDGLLESKIGVKALFLLSLNCAKQLYKIVGKDASKLVALQQRLLRQHFPNPTRKQVIAFSVLSGELQPTKEVMDMLLEGKAKGMSTFMAYYILKSLADNGYSTEATEIMREYYGGMLDKGATTFWEDFDIEWIEGSGRIDEFPKTGEKDIHGDYGRYCYQGFRHSLCHGWASGPVPYLTEFVLGVKVLEAGCKKIAIKPELGNLAYAIGDYPTPYGNIHIEHKKEKGVVKTVFTAPKEVEVVLL